MKLMLLTLARVMSYDQMAKGCLGLFIMLVLWTIISMLASWWIEIKAIFCLAKEKPGYLMPPLHDFSATIPAAHIFGFQQSSSLGDLPITTAALKLKGIIQVSHGGVHMAKAIIAVNADVDKVYQEGALLPGGIILAVIGTDTVILNNKRHWEYLSWDHPLANPVE